MATVENQITHKESTMHKQTVSYPFAHLLNKVVPRTLVFTALVTANLASAQVVSSMKNPNQIATLRWYAANQTTAFPTGSGPYGVAFDGSSIWVVNDFAGTVSKLRASDGEALGTFTVGPFPEFVAFDGANVWITNGDNTVTELRAAKVDWLGRSQSAPAPVVLRLTVRTSGSLTPPATT
jgi:hypothetical protein